ncbi:MAG: hypothetical protein A2953_01425 [Candidatus Levybacteria bacterium RIFCSPLOWO2_01_FULL_36_54]|nr:MAG: hypothetical protein A2953_01425 [Candidatus Levybacteria bacterium RIFCSPLOWO2_01_FULL_36_54]
MEGFEKIDLDSDTKDEIPPASKVYSSRRVSGSKTNLPGFLRGKNSMKILAAVVIIILISGFTIILPAQKTLTSARKTYRQAQVTLNALKKQNVELASLELDKTKQGLEETQKNLNALSYLKFIPLLGGYYNDADRLVNAGFDGLGAARILIDSVKPYADILGLKGQGSFVGGTAEKRIETAVATMGKVTPRIDDISKYLADAKIQVDEINPNRYPSFLGFSKIQKSLITLRKTTDNAATFIDEARPLIKILPNLLGEPDSKKYLILFQNDKELRPTGGFITAYAIFRIDKGIIHVDRSDNIYNLDATIPNKPKAPDPIRKYLPKVPVFNLRDTNLSPDFIESMKTFNSLYDKARGKVEVDGIIALDTSVLVSTIKILDDRVDAAGTTFTTKIDKRCDCPQVIYELERNISTPLSLDLRVSDLEAIQAGRKAIIGDLLYAILTKALKSSPKLYWGPLFQDLTTQINQKHVLFYLYDKDAQQGIQAVGADGRIRPFAGDYLHINEANFGGQKANLYVTKTVSQDYQVKNEGNIVKTVTINYKNPYPASDCNLERGGLCLNAVYRNWFRIYTPLGSKLITSKGSEVKMISYSELGKTVFEGFLTVRPQGTAVLTVSYVLPKNIASDSVLPLLIQKQPGTGHEQYSIKVNGRQVEKLTLSTDKEIKVNIK